MRRATVWWGDAHHDMSDHDADEIEKRHRPIIVATTGWVVRSDRIGISLVLDWKSHGENVGFYGYDYRGHHFIPRKMIQRIEWLEPKV